MTHELLTYEPKKFDLPELKGISAEQVKVHLALYEGYVKHVNLIAKTLKNARENNIEMDSYLQSELRRRFPFEFNGMRMHEYYFEQLEKGPSVLSVEGELSKVGAYKYGEGGLEGHLREVAATRGIGWVVAYLDDRAKDLHVVFVGDHELGQLGGLPVLLALDMWEHAYMVDYKPADKKSYVDAFFNNLNWGIVEERFDRATT